MGAITSNFNLILNILRIGIDILAVWIILYYVITMFNTNVRTMQLFKGVIAILLVKVLTSFFGLTTLNTLVDTVLNWGILGIIIIFQPEIRSILERVGQTKNDYRHLASTDEKKRIMDELVTAITTLSKDQTGALITFERTSSLADFINTGTHLNCDIKSELILTIFYEGTLLHDGAMIIKDDHIVAAACFYPPTNKELPARYGARHRAAIGISEINDSLTVIVSEETGTISFASEGNLRKVSSSELRSQLVKELQWFNSGEDDEDE